MRCWQSDLKRVVVGLFWMVSVSGLFAAAEQSDAERIRAMEKICRGGSGAAGAEYIAVA